MSYRILSLFLITVCSWGQYLSTPASPTMPASRVPLRADNGDDSLAASEAFVFVTPARTAPAGLVPADELSRTVSKKGARLLNKARDYVDSGNHKKAIEALLEAVNEPSAAPFAHGVLGTEYLKIGRIADAVTELEQSVQLLPHNVPSRSNLGYALYLAGEQERGEQEVRKALVLDSSNAKTRYVLSLIERGRGQ